MEKNWWLVTIRYKKHGLTVWEPFYGEEEEVKKIVLTHEKNGYSVTVDKLGKDGVKVRWRAW